MSTVINSVNIIGDIVSAPESKIIGTTQCAEFRIACNEHFKKQGSDQWDTKSSYFNVIVWGENRIKNIMEKGSVGMKIALNGKLKSTQWKTPEGQNRSKVSIDAENYMLINR